MVTNQQIIAALRVSDTKKEAAELLGVSRQTLHERIRRPDFIQELEQAAEAETAATEAVLNSAVGRAIEFLDSVVSDESIFGYSNAERIRAAQVLLGYQKGQ